MKRDRRPRARCGVGTCRAIIIVGRGTLQGTCCENCYMGTSPACARVGLQPDMNAIRACMLRRYERVSEIHEGRVRSTGKEYMARTAARWLDQRRREAIRLREALRDAGPSRD